MAAVALRHGIADPLALLGLSLADARVTNAVLEVAVEQQHDHDKALADYLAGEIAGRVVPNLARVHVAMTRELVKALSQRR